MSEIIPTWDLSDLYSGIHDPKIDQDIAFSLKESELFEKKYREQINNSIKPEFLLQIFQEFESLVLPVAKAAQFTHLVFSTDSITPENGVIMQKVNEQYLKIRRNLIFLEVMLAGLDESTLKALSENSTLSNYKHFVQQIIVGKPHQLPEESEKIFNDKSLTTSAFVRLFDQHFSQKKFEVAIDGQVKHLTEEEALSLLQDPDRNKRKAAAEGITKGLEADKSMTSLIYNTLVKDKAINDDYRKYSSPEEGRHLSNEIDQETVDTLTAAITSNYSIVQDFYNFKKEIMGLPELFAYDRYAPISASTKEYKFEEARTIILQSFEKFSPEFKEHANKFFLNNWIDAQTKNGKRGGAYCSYLTPDTHPVVFMNFEGKSRDVKTLAHELGHAINGVYMSQQTLLNYDNPLTLAETASVFAEFLLFEEQKKIITDPQEKFDLYIDKIQNIFATVFRQISMYLFEKDVHNIQRQKGELTTDEINALWMKHQKDMYGNSTTLEAQYGIWWSYIPHFQHTPFYVYAYSFGELLVLGLIAQYKEQGSAFVPKYIELMKAGATKSPQELLKEFGIDVKDKDFWLAGIDQIREIVNEAKEIYKQIKK